MKRPLVVLVLLALTFFYALATGTTLYYRIIYVLGFAFIASYVWGYLNSRGIQVQVQRQVGPIQVGDTIEDRIAIHNTLALPKTWLEVQELTTMPGPDAGQVVSMGGYGSRTWRNRIPVRQRGVYTLGPVQISSSDPFGLFHHKRLFPGEEEVVVYPATVDLPYLSLPGMGLPEEGPRRHPSLRPTPYASTVREYLPSDTFGRIHWPTTARMGKLMVKQFDQGVGNDLWMVVDLQGDVQAGIGYETSDEYAVTVAASVARKFLGVHVPVGLVAHGQEPLRFPPDQSSGQLGRLLDVLARATAEGSLSLADVLFGSRRLFEASGTVMVITPSTDPSWVAALAPILLRGAQAMAVLVDPSSFGASRGIEEVRDRLALERIPTYVVGRGEPLGVSLSLPWESTPPAVSGPTALYQRGRV